MRRTVRLVSCVLALLAVLPAPAARRKHAVADFYRGKTIT